MIDVLLAEDETKLATIVMDSLQTLHFRVRHCTNGAQAWHSFQLSKPDIVVMDVMMPEIDGYTLASKIRQHDRTIPLIFLTARTALEDVLSGFRSGGNDYLKKPFNMDELIARMESLLRLSNRYNPGEQLMIGNYLLDNIKHTLHIGNRYIQLSYRESELLKRLYEHRNQVVHRQEILFEFWNNDRFFTGRSLDVFISRLRKYLMEDPNIKIINVRGVGYKMVV
ncbi:response regulator transcription factor [Parapedobacter sp. GCM10030251]|jgi:Response regulators consisting of a CheY-like receiver domain and a winged-helix DNA-binding domain|uniref:response regulator transcription factor n=1 Tax=Parapedobacter sp. GCM10030251 TaxID=3273419 RepID=UPI003612C550